MLKPTLAALFILVGVALSPIAVAADDWTDIRYYAASKDIPHVTAMLDRGVSVNIQNDEGWTPLMIAAEAGDPAMVRLLLSRGADASIANNRGRTAYDVTLSSEVRALLKPAATKPTGSSAVSAEPPRTTGFTPKPSTAVAPAASSSASSTADPERRTFCQAQYRAAVAAFCSDDTCKLRENRKWSSCLKSGRYN